MIFEFGLPNALKPLPGHATTNSEGTLQPAVQVLAAQCPETFAMLDIKNSTASLQHALQVLAAQFTKTSAMLDNKNSEGLQQRALRVLAAQSPERFSRPCHQKTRRARCCQPSGFSYPRVLVFMVCLPVDICTKA